jgi:hypothetical protein
MFEVVISTVSTGRVQRKLFETREKADRYVERRVARAYDPRTRKGSARHYRFEVYQRPAPAVRPVPVAAPAAA